MFCCYSASVIVKDESTHSVSQGSDSSHNSVQSTMISMLNGSDVNTGGDVREWRYFRTVKAAVEHYSTMPYATSTITERQAEMLTVLEIDL
jgi:hypothetical protein